MQKSTNYKIYPFCESSKYLCEKIRTGLTGGTSILFTQKAVVEETIIRNSSNICVKKIVGINASKLYTFSMCQDMPTGLYMKWEHDTDLQKFRARHTQSQVFENLVMSFYQGTRSEYKNESFFRSGKQKNCFNLDGYCDH